MAKQKKTKQQAPTKKSTTAETFITLDNKRIPLEGARAGAFSPEAKYPYEFRLLDSMRVGQSAIFPKEKDNVIGAIRTRIRKLNGKKFIVRKVNPTQSRIWRVADNAVIRKGGRIAGVSPYKKAAPTDEQKTEQ